jgi:hypothetical protein
MRYLSIILTLCLTYSPTWACDPSTDITKNQDGSYTYTKECHVEVGKKVEENEKRKEQVTKLYQVIELKDLALVKSHERIELWRDTSFKMEDKVNSLEKMKETNKWLYFGVGVVVMSLAVYGAGQLR